MGFVITVGLCSAFEFLKTELHVRLPESNGRPTICHFFLGKPMDSISKFIYGRDPSFSAHVGLCDRVRESFCGATWQRSQSWVVYQRLQWFIIKPIDDFALMISPQDISMISPKNWLLFPVTCGHFFLTWSRLPTGAAWRLKKWYGWFTHGRCGGSTLPCWWMIVDYHGQGSWEWPWIWQWIWKILLSDSWLGTLLINVYNV